MLQLRSALGGQASISGGPHALAHLSVDATTYIVYPSSDSVVVCDEALELSCTLSFAASMPGRASSSSSAALGGVYCSAPHGLIIAWRDQHIAFWRHKPGAGLAAWKPWSTLVSSGPVTCLDFKDGDLVIGMLNGVESWHVDMSADIEVWDRRWERSCATPRRICFSPATEHIAWSTDGQPGIVSILTLAKGVPKGAAQDVKHSRVVNWIGWRKPRDRKGGDVHLYTISNSALRVFAPVLDDPSWFQLHTTVDGRQGGKRGTLVVFDADEWRTGGHDKLELAEDDMVGCIAQDGSFTVRAVLNMDRKPPTLMKTVPVASIAVAIQPHVGSNTTAEARLIHLADRRMMLLLPGDRLSAYIVHPDKLLSSKSEGIKDLLPKQDGSAPAKVVQMSDKIQRFYRTPNGRGLLAMGEKEVGVWQKRPVGRGKGKAKALDGKGHWTTEGNRLMAIFAKGRGIVSYSPSPSRISLQHLGDDDLQPSPAVSMPGFACEDEIVLLLAVSDIDDGMSAAGRKTQKAYIIAASDKAEVWTWRIISAVQTGEDSNQPPDITLISRYTLPVDKPEHILPVDPMGWHQSVIDWTNESPLQDMVMTVSSGVLGFWKPHLGESASQSRRGSHGAWIRTGTVKTDKRDVVIARCSSRKKTALATKLAQGYELSIWDSKASDFSSGLEFTQPYDDDIQDLDWTTTSDLQSVLAVGMPHRVVLVCEERMSYVGNTPGWAAFLTIDVSNYTADPIADSIWLAGGSLAVGAGNQVLLFSRFLEQAPEEAENEAEDIFQLIAQRNGPVVDFHPAMLAQCLLWDKLELVKRILLTLLQALQSARDAGNRFIRYERLDASSYYTKKSDAATSLFDSGTFIKFEGEALFDEKAAGALQSLLEGDTKLPLSASERELLPRIARAVVEIDRERRALDMNALRYIFAVRMLVNSQVDTELIAARNLVWAMHSESQEAMLRAATESCDGKMMWADARRLGVFQWLKESQLAGQMDVVARNTFLADDRDPTGCSLFYFALGKKRIVHGLWRQASGHNEQQAMLRFLANDFDEPRWKTAANKNAYALLSKQRFAYAAAFFLLAGSHRDAVNVCLRQLRDVPLAIAIARVVDGDDGPLMKWILTDTVIPLAFAGGHRWLGSWAFWTLGRRDLSIRMLISPLKDVARSYNDSLPVGESENDDPSLGLLYQQLKGKTLQTAKGTSEINEKTEFDFVLHNARVFCRMGCHPLALALVRSWSFERPVLPTKRPNPLRSPTARRQSFMLAAGDVPRKSMIMDMVIIESRSQSPEAMAAPRVASLMKAKQAEASQGGMDFDMGSFGAEPPQPPKAASLMKAHIPGASQGAMDFDMGAFGGEDEAGQPKVASLMKVNGANGSQGAMEFDMGAFGGPPAPVPSKGVSLVKSSQRDSQGGMEFDVGAFGSTPAPVVESTATNGEKAEAQIQAPPKGKVASLMKAAEPEAASQGAIEFDFSAFS